MNSNFERDSLMAVFKSKRVWLINAVAYALLFAAFFYWLQIKEETGVWFAVTVISGLLIVFVKLLLQGTTFDYFRSGMSFASSIRRVIPRIPLLLLWGFVFGATMWLLAQLWDYTAQAGGWTRHLLPEFIRGQVSPRSVISAVSGLLWFVICFALPIMFLPIGSWIASYGFREIFTRAAWPIREIRFWLAYAICFVIGAYFPYKLAYMTPARPSPLSTQAWSMVLRLGVGYLLFITAWIVLCAAIARATAEPEAVARPSLEPAPTV